MASRDRAADARRSVSPLPFVLAAAALLPLVVAAGQSPPSQSPTFRASTTLVEVDAIVKDGHGRFVSVLKPSDFEVSEDGKPQVIDTFYVVEGREVRTSDVHAASGVPETAAIGSLPSATEPAALSRQAIQRVFILWFDVDHMAVGGVRRGKLAAAEFIRTEFHPGDIGGVVAGGSMANNRLTNVKEELATAVDSLVPSPNVRQRELDMQEWPRFLSLYEAAGVDAGDDKVTDRIVARACLDDGDRCSSREDARLEVVTKGRRLIGEARFSAQGTLSTLDRLNRGLVRLPGRKTVVYFSDGFYSEQLVGQLQDAIGGAGRANVRVYAIDTRGLNRGSADSRILDAPPHAPVVLAPDIPAELPEFDIGIDGPNSLAVDTGGLMIRNENDLPRALHEIASDTSFYYVIGYRPPAASADGKFHTIKVRVKVPGLTVRARKGYVATAGAPPAAPEVPPAASAAPAARSTGDAVPRSPAAALPVPALPLVAVLSIPPSSSGTALMDSGSVRLRPFDRAPSSDALRLRDGPSGGAGVSSPFPDALMDQAQQGWIAYQRGDTKGALAALSAPAAHPSAPAWVNYVLGWSAFAEGDLVAARNAWNVVRTVAADFQPVYFDIADAYLRQGKRAEALVMLRTAEGRWPSSLEVLNAVGVVETSLGELDAAVVSFERALTLAPGDETSLFNLAASKEMRYLHSVRQPTPREADRTDAITVYGQVVGAGGPLAERASQAIRRLTPLDVRALKNRGAESGDVDPSVAPPRPCRAIGLVAGRTGGLRLGVEP